MEACIRGSSRLLAQGTVVPPCSLEKKPGAGLRALPPCHTWLHSGLRDRAQPSHGGHPWNSLYEENMPGSSYTACSLGLPVYVESMPGSPYTACSHERIPHHGALRKHPGVIRLTGSGDRSPPLFRRMMSSAGLRGLQAPLCSPPLSHLTMLGFLGPFPAL